MGNFSAKVAGAIDLDEAGLFLHVSPVNAAASVSAGFRHQAASIKLMSSHVCF